MLSFRRREFLFIYKAVFFLFISRLNNSSSILILKTQGVYLKPTGLLVYNNTSVVVLRSRDSMEVRLDFIGSKAAESEASIINF